MDTSHNNIFILGLVVSLLQTKPIYLEIKEYIKLLKWKIKLSNINEDKNNSNNNDDKNKDEMLKLLISKLNTVIKDWVELKSTYTLNSNRKRTINIDPNKDFFINIINDNVILS
ncbi:hypothetical protein H8356DRAFT_1282369 [Neocallimastix lanati (nom. inval.)]|uniref:Uncharacterized protein n=1 Tax=Neocallimastix californiae TaxID=1754190 RepID=A0A1Y2D8J8_9FUNG|nr:hypothetical protein H8356DRAFT_1282369 [Neocallimastix sp. JGI-2020a]ORY55592.1 hypothetical protein LY90DRAFT_507072 [Neocallimastix californiae]|eukprot:ORY55592.1 hypothetical protein LY90DRAFT_507072 [Neocallimastix californiae]